MREPASLVVGQGADEMRRAVGPTAWVALEVLAARSARVDAEQGITTSVRQMAAALGLSKNAAHRALRRLVESGLAAPVQERAVDGRFLAGAYRLKVPADVLRVVADSDLVPALDATVRPRTPRRRPPADRSVQLDLLTDAG